jgi:signal peptidase I
MTSTKSAVLTNVIQPNQYARETVESIIVAFILAFLFRAFVAEAFVIPTGSMAPTLMGAHKDLTCSECGSQYQVGASLEFESDTGARTGNYVIGSNSSICRSVNPIDFSDANQATFSGDRILVSKFDYVLSKPKRWDVLVFKFPEEARMNYIKRLIGLPDEQLMIREGDIYVRQDASQSWEIARKPPHKFKAMMQPVADTDHLSPRLVKAGYPSLWQPWSADNQVATVRPAGDTTASQQGAGWKVQQSEQGWSANLTSTPSTNWLRYYHKEVTSAQWLDIEQGKSIGPVSPTSSQLVTDFLAYNSYYATPLRRPEEFQIDAADLARQPQMENGMHWVGDLMGQFDVEVKSDSGLIFLQLIEFGIEHRVAIDVATGEVKLSAWDASQVEPKQFDKFYDGETDLVAACKVNGQGSYQLAMANVDDQILLWVNDRLVKFNQPANFNSWILRDQSQRRPFWSLNHPLDAAPVALGGQGVALSATRAQVFRDLYYTAVHRQGYRNFDSTDFGNARDQLRDLAPAGQSANVMSDSQIVRSVYSTPESWAETKLFSLRNQNSYELGPGQYLPLGDNSAQSSDGRMWQRNYVEEKYLLGKALLVFWPHYWNRPIPFLPNFGRMGLIR